MSNIINIDSLKQKKLKEKVYTIRNPYHPDNMKEDLEMFESNIQNYNYYKGVGVLTDDEAVSSKSIAVSILAMAIIVFSSSYAITSSLI